LHLGLKSVSSPEVKQKQFSYQPHFDELAPKAVLGKRVLICGVKGTQGKELSSPYLETVIYQQGLYQENSASEARLWDSVQG